jgi:hypothetical protein
MKNDPKDSISDVVENLPTMASDNEDRPEGTVISGDGERITLGECVSNNTSVQSTD